MFRFNSKILLYNEKNGFGRRSQQNASAQGSEIPSHKDITLREKLSPFSCVDVNGAIARMEQWSHKFKIRKTCQEEKVVGQKRRKLGSSVLVFLEKQKVDVGHTDRAQK